MKAGRNNPFYGSIGKIGNTGFYKRFVNGMEIVQRCPTRKNSNGPHDHTLQVQRFLTAMDNTSVILQNPEIRALYEKVARGTASAKSMAIKDYLVPAVIGQVVTTGYFGRVDFCISIVVKNVVPVKSVMVTIENPAGEMVESGQAVMQSSGTLWHYLTTRPNPLYKGSILRIVSCDLPGHTIEWSVVL